MIDAIIENKKKQIKLLEELKETLRIENSDYIIRNVSDRISALMYKGQVIMVDKPYRVKTWLRLRGLEYKETEL